MDRAYRAISILVIVFATLLILVRSATACHDPSKGTITLLHKLPTTAENEPVVAAVEAIELLSPPWKKDDSWGKTPRVRVRVVEAIKGVQEGQHLIVDTQGGGCDQAFRRGESYFQTYLTNRRFFIAGQFEVTGWKDIVFGGQWRQDENDDLIPMRRKK